MLIIHNWAGVLQGTKDRAIQFAGKGVTAFCVDMYGKGKRGDLANAALNNQLMMEVSECCNNTFFSFAIKA